MQPYVFHFDQMKRATCRVKKIEFPLVGCGLTRHHTLRLAWRLGSTPKLAHFGFLQCLLGLPQRPLPSPVQSFFRAP